MFKQVGIVLFVVLAYGFQVFIRRHWYFAQIKREDFSFAPNFVERQIETEYYEPGKLGEHLRTVIYIASMSVYLSIVLLCIYAVA